MNRLARQIAELGMTAPAILFLESSKPLAFLGAQFLWMAQPLFAFGGAELNDLATLIQDNAGIDALIDHLEALRAEAGTAQ